MEVTPPTSLYASIAPLEDTNSGVDEAVIYGGELAWNLNTDKTTTFVNSECPPGTQAINRNRSLGCEPCPIGFYKPFSQLGCVPCPKGISTTRDTGAESKDSCDICLVDNDSAGVCALEKSLEN